MHEERCADHFSQETHTNGAARMQRKCWVICATVAIVSTVAVYSDAQTTVVDLVAEFGDHVPDSATLMRGFGLPAIDDTGRVVFRGNVGQITPSFIIFETPGLSSQVIRMPDEAPGFTNDDGEPLFFLPFSSPPLLNPVGTVAFTSAIRDESGSSSVSSVLFTGPSVSNLSHIARTDTLDLPGLSELVQADIASFALNNSGTAAFMTVPFGAEPDLLAVFRVASGNGPNRIAIAGDQAPDTPTGALFSNFWPDSLVINSRGDVAFRGNLEPGVGGVTFSNDEGIWCLCGGELRLVAREGDAAPGASGDPPFRGFLDKPAISPTGEVAFQGRLGNSFTPSGIWRGTSPADLRIAGGAGASIPTTLGFSDSLFGFSGPVFVSDTELLFIANGLATTDAIWSEAGGVLQPIVKGNISLDDGTVIPGDVAPGTTGVFFDFGKFAVNPGGKVVFTGNYEGSGWGVPRGLWAQDADGVLQDVVQPGDVVLTQRGLRTIADTQFPDGPGPTSGKSTSFSDGFEVAFLARFDSNLDAIIRVPVGDVPPPGNIYKWNGGAGDDNWHTNNGKTTNWIDTRDLPRSPPGESGPAIVTIRENVPVTGVVLNERAVSIGSLTAEGGLTIAQPLTLAEDSSIESLQLNAEFAFGATGNEVLTTSGELSLSGNSAWRLGWIDTTTSRIVNQGAFAIDSIVAPIEAQLGGVIPPKRIRGRYTNIDEATTLQKDDVDLDNAVIENQTGGTWKIVKGNMTVGLGGGSVENAGLLFKPDSEDTADSAIDAFYSAGPVSHTDVDAGKIILRGGAEFLGGAKVVLNISRTDVNLANTSELELAAEGAANRTYQFKSGNTEIRLANGLVFPGDGILRLSPGAILSASIDGELELKNVKFMLDGGDIVGPGLIAVDRGTVSWNSGTIGRSDLGPNSASVFIEGAILNILAGAPKTLAGTLNISTFNSRVSQAADLILDGGRVVVGAGTWTIRGNSSVMANSGGEFVVSATSSGALTIDVDTQVAFSAALDNKGTVEVVSGRLLLTGPIEQVTGTVLTGGTWRIQGIGQIPNPPILDMPNHTINTIGAGAHIILGSSSSFPQLQAGTNNGELELTSGAVLSLPSLINNGRIIVSGDNTTKLTINPTLTNKGELSINDSAVVEVASTFESHAGSTNKIEGELTAPILRFLGGDFSGNGTINGNLLEHVVGNLAPGQSPGILTINANYVQSSTATLDIELGGLIPGTEHDQLVINGDATLAGTLRLVPLKGFLPLVGQAYEILTVTGGTHTGEFETIVGPGEYNVAYTADGVTVTVLTMPADSDGDNDLDLFDFRDLTTCMPNSIPAAGVDCSIFDMNADGSVNLVDWCAFQTVFTGSAP